MTEMKREILTASGSKLTVLGKTIIDIDINGYVCSNVAIVADINVDGILGLDLHRSQNCTINVAKGSILIQGHEVCLNSLIETRVTVAPVSTNTVAFNPFTLAFINIPASLANLLTPMEPLL
jgi:hypothetical protein